MAKHPFESDPEWARKAAAVRHIDQRVLKAAAGRKPGHPCPHPNRDYGGCPICDEPAKVKP